MENKSIYQSEIESKKNKENNKIIVGVSGSYLDDNLIKNAIEAVEKIPNPVVELKIYTDNGQRIYQVEIQVTRNRSNDDLSFAVSALANMGQYAKKPFKKYVVIMHSDMRGKNSDICEANSRCTADYMIRKQVTYDHWYKKCITFTSGWGKYH